jgi:hypothetical protein
MTENTQKGEIRQKRKIHEEKPPHTTHKILVGHMLGKDALECVDNLVVDQISINSTLPQELCSSSLQQR